MRITIQPGVNTPYNGGIVRSRWRYVRVICLTLSTCLAPQFPNERRRMSPQVSQAGNQVLPSRLVNVFSFTSENKCQNTKCTGEWQVQQKVFGLARVKSCAKSPLVYGPMHVRKIGGLLAPGKPVVYRPSDLSQGAVKLTAEESPVDPRIAACQARCVRVIVFGEGRSCRPRHRHSWRCESICALPRRDIEPR
ncbi:hypothetical protein Bbelb_432000 [Branchiostoma belcheri]|nr:hypothetical protein Bbelb_432000 [Branchiostoma belcheri]